MLENIACVLNELSLMVLMFWDTFSYYINPAGVFLFKQTPVGTPGKHMKSIQNQ